MNDYQKIDEMLSSLRTYWSLSNSDFYEVITDILSKITSRNRSDEAIYNSIQELIKQKRGL